MSTAQHIAVIDVGKTNAKLAIVDGESLKEIAVATRPNTVLAGPPWPHFDLEGIWEFFLKSLREFHAEHGITAISVTTHGASGVLLDQNAELAVPMLDYEHEAPDTVRAEYDKIRPPFEKTGSPPLPMGLNLGAQLFWQFHNDPSLKTRVAHFLTYPQYWAYRLTGEMATDVTSLGCHTDLWEPFGNKFSSLVADLGLEDKIAPPKHPSDVAGTITPEIAMQTGLAADTKVVCGIHDSNASLLPYLNSQKGPFAVVSTGTWVISMAMGGTQLAPDPTRDTLVNVNALGQPVPSARFMGGREYELTRVKDVEPSQAEREAVLANGTMILPAVEPSSGPFQGQQSEFTSEPQTDGQRNVALAYYLALMTDTCLTLAGAQGPVIVEGPFAANADFCAMLAAQRAGGVQIAKSSTGTSIGSALLVLKNAAAPDTQTVTPSNIEAMRAYASRWHELVNAR